MNSELLFVMPERYRSVELGPSARWSLWLERTGHPEYLGKLNEFHPMVYFSAEYGLPGLTRAGGLGMLSGDHELQARFLGLPAYFLGLIYSVHKEQKIAFDGKGHFWQEEEIHDAPDPETFGIKKRNEINVILNGAFGPDDKINVFRYPNSTGRTNLFLLQVPDEVYPKDASSDARLWDYTVLGFGGYQIIKQLREEGKIIEPSVYHLNESATVLGALAALDDKTLAYGDNFEAFKAARSELEPKTILTNHTLVPVAEADYDRNQANEFVFSNLKSREVRNQLDVFINQRGGRLVLLDLALYLAGKYNCVSELHGRIATESFGNKYGNIFYGNKVEFKAVTNGIYEERWNPPMFNLLQNHKVLDEFGLPVRKNFETNVEKLNDRDLIKIKSDAVGAFREYLERGERKDQFGRIITVPDNALVVGYGRRPVDYKRPGMIFTYPEELKGILTRHSRAHIFISGKAHANDESGKNVIRFILENIASDRLFAERIHFLPNWDPDIALALGPACHVWINNPRVRWEACGTSGMKTGLGGALQVSTKDGFYAELPDSSYYMIDGITDSPEEFKSYYFQLERAITDAENPALWTAGVKRLWKGGLLAIASGARMVDDYTEMELE